MAIEGVGFDSKETVQEFINKIKSQRGELVPSVSYYQTGNKTSDTTSWGIGETGTFIITLSTAMPDTDYIVVPTLDVVGVSLSVHSKTVNDFKVTVRNDSAETIAQPITLYWQAFKLMTDESRALDEQAIASLQAVVPSSASASNKLVTESEISKVKETADDARLNATLARDEIGDITALETTTQDDLVSAINEVKEKTDNNEINIGDLSDLQTSTKTDLVSAINEAAEGSFFVKIYNSLSEIQSAKEHDIVLIKSSETLPSYVGISLSGKTPPYTLFRYEKDGSNTLKWVPISSSTSSYIQRYSLGSVLNRVVVDSSGTITISQESFEKMFGTKTVARASLEIKALVSGEFKTVAYMMFNIVGNVIRDYRGLTTSNVTYSGKTATVTGLPTTGTNYQLYPVVYSSENNYS